jgi:AcrR family transcriptional regulator
MPNRKATLLLDHLKPIEAQIVLTELLEAHPSLRPEAEQIARSQIADVALEAVAEEVEEALRALDLTDLHGRAGRHALGYTEPGEAAWELIEETLDPFFEELRRQLAIDADAAESCQGIVLGLYRLEQAKDWELGEWALDALPEMAGEAVDRLRKGLAGVKKLGPPTLPEEFLADRVPEWKSWLLKL